ncbi:SDR family NAD(P)-dependent oxidoreductase [Actinomycetospora termitidis]|uniref:SDR family NAD(P)-dependent oxidoreductase n=1 Tax=Actinomycetospora termitidis TaxID=3053470 RepID=A0ABT7M635_9PSEU|nr:SDR family NAD(P)-dependent oxidoreductase [Actinomycetospora sp. Odt1-22]MDL5156128.1 SDR family NAD(P)-dependent oxidoreductase [Actinomycetospora sp. Odt1-22]
MQDKVVIVAGAGSGLGRATAVRLAREGARVVVGDLDGRGVDGTVAEIAGSGGECVGSVFDISDDTSCADLVEVATKTFGAVHGLFNVAADTSAQTLGRDTDVVTVPLEVWRRSLEVNLTGYFLMARHAIPALLDSGGGAIVNTISGLVLYGDANRVAYGASKSGILALSKHIAIGWGKRNIRCNTVAPGLVLTEQSATLNSDDYQAEVLTRVHAPRLGVPDDIASAVTFLLSDEASWINGQVLPVNGGRGLG